MLRVRACLMNDGRSLISRLRLSERSLRALLILLVVDVFIVAPIAQGETLAELQPVIHSCRASRLRSGACTSNSK